jgi:hypothetical protein
MNLQLHAIKTADLKQRVANLHRSCWLEGTENLDDNSKMLGLEWGDHQKVSQAPPKPVAEETPKADGLINGLYIKK